MTDLNIVFATEIKKEVYSNKDEDKEDFPFVLKIQLEEKSMVKFMKDLQKKHKTANHFIDDSIFEIKLKDLEDSNLGELDLSSPFFIELGLFGVRKFKKKKYLDFRIITLLDYDPSSSEEDPSYFEEDPFDDDGGFFW